MTATAEPLHLDAGSRTPLFGGYRNRLRAILEVDLLEVADALLGDVVADHPVALRRQLVHVDIHGVEAAGPLGDQAGVVQGLDEHPEDVGVALELAVRVALLPPLDD